MKLYGLSISPFVRKVAVTLQLKNLAFESVSVTPGDLEHPEFRTLSPLHKVPAFSDGDIGLADSSVICEYLEDQYPEVATYPTTPILKAHARWLEEYADTKLVEICGSGLFFQRIVKPAFMGEAGDEALVHETLSVKMPEALNYLEARINELTAASSSAYLFGDLSVADIAIASPFLNARYAGFQVDASQWPATAHYLDAIWQHPAFAEQIEQEQPVIADLLTKAKQAA